MEMVRAGSTVHRKTITILTARAAAASMMWKSLLKKDMEKDLSKKLGFIVNHHRVEFYGICRDCQ